jgi:S-adenosylmethionine/arginine decarboxylase-like enzyme
MLSKDIFQPWKTIIKNDELGNFYKSKLLHWRSSESYSTEYPTMFDVLFEKEKSSLISRSNVEVLEQIFKDHGISNIVIIKEEELFDCLNTPKCFENIKKATSIIIRNYFGGSSIIINANELQYSHISIYTKLNNLSETYSLLDEKEYLKLKERLILERWEYGYSDYIRKYLKKEYSNIDDIWDSNKVYNYLIDNNKIDIIEADDIIVDIKNNYNNIYSDLIK